MSRETFRFVAALAFMLALSTTAAWAQFGAQLGEAGPGTVSGMGTVSVKQKPTLLRMTIQLQEKGKTVQESLAKLKDRRDAAVLQLQELGAKKDDIVASDPTLSAGQTEEEQQMQQMMMQQMRARGRAPRGLQVPKSVATSTTLTVEWPLTMETNEELLLFADTLQEKIKAADLAGLNEPKQLTPEEEELQAEMEETMSDYSYGSEQAKPGEPSFVYVARISEDERAKALAAAFDKAKAQAQRLAVAARAKLGALSSVSGGTSQSNDDAYGYNGYAVQMMMAQAASSSDDENEAMTASPGMVTFQVMVNAAFRLE
ncbi:MAG: SIMPL domain-containing protein [Planctomycetota bacterium]|nr:SIMPL domain-containing protein [Planctomycetota bacterium]